MTGQTRFRGWWIVGVAFVAQAVAIGFSIIPYGLFIDPIVREFGASVMATNSGLALLFVVMTAVGPVLGPLVDQHSIRGIMTAGALVMAGSFALMSVATSLWQVGVLFGVGVAVGVALLGPLPATAVVAKWFERRRGRALGIAAIGPMAGGLALVPLIGVMVGSIGWRASLRWFAVGVLAVIPLVWAVIRNRPEDLGQLPDGEPPAGAGPSEEGVAWTTGEILGVRDFWALALGVGIVFGMGGGWNANAPKYVTDLGYPVEQAGYLLAAGAGAGILGTVLFGLLADRLDNRGLLWTAIAAQAAALAALWTEPGALVLAGVFALFGFAAGALLPVYASLVGRLFGPRSFGQVMGLAGVVMLPFGALAPPLAGRLRDGSGSYSSTLLLFIASFLVAAACLGLMRPGAGRRGPLVAS